MKLVKIKTFTTSGGESEEGEIVVNCDQIATIHTAEVPRGAHLKTQAIITMAGDLQPIKTMFSDAEHAVDYLHRAANFSPTPRYEGPQ